MKSPRYRVLENFLNDTVFQVNDKLFLWRNRWYEVLIRADIKKVGSKPDHFIKQSAGKRTFYIRELSNNLLRKNYKLTIDK